jgi:hypothetical protein
VQPAQENTELRKQRKHDDQPIGAHARNPAPSLAASSGCGERILAVISEIPCGGGEIVCPACFKRVRQICFEHLADNANWPVQGAAS